MDLESMLIRSEADRLAHVLSRVGPDRPVPTCPQWRAADLLWHLTAVHEMWSQILATGATTDEDAQRVEDAIAPRPDAPAEVQRRRAAATSALITQLEAREDRDPAWTWLPREQTVGFIRRMQTHEATVHRVDAQLTADIPVLAPLAHTAADGIAHCIDVMWEADHLQVPDGIQLDVVGVLDVLPDHGETHRVELIRSHGTRVSDGEQHAGVLARRMPIGIDTEDMPIAQARGSAVGLYLWAWGREPALEHLDTGPEHVALDGDAVAVVAVENLLAQGLQ